MSNSFATLRCVALLLVEANALTAAAAAAVAVSVVAGALLDAVVGGAALVRGVEERLRVADGAGGSPAEDMGGCCCIAEFRQSQDDNRAPKVNETGVDDKKRLGIPMGKEGNVGHLMVVFWRKSLCVCVCVCVCVCICVYREGGKKKSKGQRRKREFANLRFFFF